MLAALMTSAPTTVTRPAWAEFRGTNRVGFLDDARIPTAWGGETATNVVWRTAIPGFAHSSPIIVGDRVFLVTAVADVDQAAPRLTQDLEFSVDPPARYKWTVYSVNRNSGAILWTKTIDQEIPGWIRHAKGSYANSTPAASATHVVVLLGNLRMVCLSVEGKELWRRDLGFRESAKPEGPDVLPYVDHASSPTIFEDIVIVQNDWPRGGYLAAYDLQTGKEQWSVRRDEPNIVWASPVLWQKNGQPPELVVTGSRWIRGYDPRDGEPLWHLSNDVPDALHRTASPIASPDMIIAAGGAGLRPLFGIRPGARGEISEKHNGRPADLAWTVERGSPATPTPLLYRDQLYVMQDTGVLRVYDPRAGALIYQQRVAAARFTASPVASDGRIFLTSEDGQTFVVRAGPTYELLSVNDLKDPILATPALSKGLMIIRTLGGVVGIGRARR